MSTSDLFKVAYLVPDLDAAARDLARWLGVGFTPAVESPLELDTGGGREAVSLRYAYSTTGPLFIELLEAQAAGYYAAPEGAHLHHVGRWVDDLPAASAALEAEGLPREAAGVGPNGASPALFVFHRGDHGTRVELVDRANKPNFDAWLAGGELSLG